MLASRRRGTSPAESLVIRPATLADGVDLVRLIGELGYDVTYDVLVERFARLTSAGDQMIVAEAEHHVVGLMTMHLGLHVLHRPRPVGRISMLVVATTVRGTGVGRALVHHAERVAREAGCGMLEVTSNLKRADAHAFYERLGFDRTSYRFGKDVSAQV